MKKEVYKIYVATKKKDGTVVKSEAIIAKAENKDKAIEAVIKQAKAWYGYKGKVHICSVYIRDEQKKYYKLL
jgi:hypothetical protein